jgi:predicted membrane protein
MGDLQLDLRDLDLSGRSTEVLVTAGVGHIEVVVPESIQLVVIAHAGLGEVDVFGSSWDGSRIDRRVVAGGREGGGRLTVRARVGIGQVEVLRAAA